MTITDFLTFFISILLLMRGSLRGFMNSLLGPFSIIVATIISIIYYQNTKDIIPALIIGLAGPLLLQLFLKYILRTWAKATNTDIKPDFLSSFGGAILTLAWGWVFIVFALILLAALPPVMENLKIIPYDVKGSASYCYVAKPIADQFFASPKMNAPAVNKDTARNEAKSLAQDPRFQAVLQDPEVKNDIAAHDIGKLLSNPKMMNLTRQIMSDPATMKKVFALYQAQAQAQAQTKNP